MAVVWMFKDAQRFGLGYRSLRLISAPFQTPASSAALWPCFSRQQSKNRSGNRIPSSQHPGGVLGGAGDRHYIYIYIYIDTLKKPGGGSHWNPAQLSFFASVFQRLQTRRVTLQQQQRQHDCFWSWKCCSCQRGGE